MDVYSDLRCLRCGFAGPTSPAPLRGTTKHDSGPYPRSRRDFMKIELSLWWHDDSRPHWAVKNETVSCVEVTVIGYPYTVVSSPRFKAQEIITDPPLQWDNIPARHRADFKRLLCEAIRAETSLSIKSINIPNALLTDTEE